MGTGLVYIYPTAHFKQIFIKFGQEFDFTMQAIKEIKPTDFDRFLKLRSTYMATLIVFKRDGARLLFYLGSSQRDLKQKQQI